MCMCGVVEDMDRQLEVSDKIFVQNEKMRAQKKTHQRVRGHPSICEHVRTVKPLQSPSPLLECACVGWLRMWIDN